MARSSEILFPSAINFKVGRPAEKPLLDDRARAAEVTEPLKRIAWLRKLTDLFIETPEVFQEMAVLYKQSQDHEQFAEHFSKIIERFLLRDARSPFYLQQTLFQENPEIKNGFVQTLTGQSSAAAGSDYELGVKLARTAQRIFRPLQLTIFSRMAQLEPTQSSQVNSLHQTIMEVSQHMSLSLEETAPVEQQIEQQPEQPEEEEKEEEKPVSGYRKFHDEYEHRKQEYMDRVDEILEANPAVAEQFYYSEEELGERAAVVVEEILAIDTRLQKKKLTPEDYFNAARGGVFFNETAPFPLLRIFSDPETSNKMLGEYQKALGLILTPEALEHVMCHERYIASVIIQKAMACIEEVMTQLVLKHKFGVASMDELSAPTRRKPIEWYGNQTFRMSVASFQEIAYSIENRIRRKLPYQRKNFVNYWNNKIFPYIERRQYLFGDAGFLENQLAGSRILRDRKSVV